MNVVIDGSPWIPSDIPTLFQDEEVIFSKANDLPGLMVELGIYPSSSKARHAGRSGPIPQGFVVFKASKKVTMWIWNPTE